MNFQPLYADLEEIAPDDPLLAKFAALCEARGVPPGRFNILVNLTLRRALDEAEGQPLTLASVSRAFAEHASAYGIAPEVQTEIVSTMQTTAQAIGIEGEAPPADAATTETETEETMNTDHAYPIVNPPIEGDEERTARAAHTVKGLLMIFSAQRAVGIAARLDQRAREGVVDEDSDRLLAALELDIERVKPVLAGLAKPPEKPS